MTKYLSEKRYARVSPGRRLRILRELNEMTQEQLARASGLTQATISALESGAKVDVLVTAPPSPASPARRPRRPSSSRAP